MVNRFETLESRRLLAVFVVDSTIDSFEGDCSGLEGGVCSLRVAVQESESKPGADEIHILPGHYEIFGSLDLEAGDDVRFVGMGGDPSDVVIDGISESRVFDIWSEASVGFSNLTIQNGVADDSSGGGGINAFVTELTLDNVVIQNNLADFDAWNFPSLGPSSGGGLQVGGNLTIRNSVIRDNVATKNGGGIEFYPTYDRATVLTIIDTEISGNRAGVTSHDGFGGGVFAPGNSEGSSTNVDFSRVTLRDNIAGEAGGGAYVDSAGIQLVSTNFLQNAVTGSTSVGGGLYVVDVGEADAPFNIQGGSFTSNSAVGGAGGFGAFNSVGSFEGSRIELNQVTDPGSLVGFSGYERGGGGILVLSEGQVNASNVTLRNVLVSENMGPAAGGVGAVDSNLTIEDSTIVGNHAFSTQIGSAGGIGVVASDAAPLLTIRNSTIQSNTAVLDAGGIGVIDMDAAIEGSFIDGNEAGGRAGGVGAIGFDRVPNISANGVTVSRNRSVQEGGGIGLIASQIDLLNSTVSGNTSAANMGGGIAILDGLQPSTIRFSTITSNHGIEGGNIVTSGGPVQFAYSVIADGDSMATATTLFSSMGYNLDQSGSLGLNGIGDLSGQDPSLGPLQSNGGTVPTHALLVGSPAIDIGTSGEVFVDARGVTRPQDGDGVQGPAFDAGAFEHVWVPIDLDQDGVSDLIEAGAPNGGDGNNDGVPDHTQSHVASLPSSRSSQYVSLVTSDSFPLRAVTAQVPTVDPSEYPENIDLPLGLFGFEVWGLDSSDRVDVNWIFHADPELNSMQHYDSTGGEDPMHSFAFDPGHDIGILAINRGTATTRYADGLVGEATPQLNGIVTVIAGPGLANGIPAQNPISRTDVNNDGRTTSMDALRIINVLGRLQDDPSQGFPADSESFFDVNGDLDVSALDALQVVNQLARQQRAGEGEPFVGIDWKNVNTMDDREWLALSGQRISLGTLESDFDLLISSTKDDDYMVAIDGYFLGR